MAIPVVTVSSSGKTLDPTIELLSLQVMRELNRIPEATLVLLDGSIPQRKYELSNQAFFEPGKLITIALRYVDDARDTIVFEGFVVRHAVENTGDGAHLRIELKDPAFKLTRGRKTAVFRSQSDSQAISSILKTAGVKEEHIEPTNTTQKELVQYNATDWDFILSRLDILGMVASVHRGKLSTHAISLDAPKRKLDHGLDDVSELSLEVDVTQQWAQVSGIGWDPMTVAATPPEIAQAPSFKVGNLDAKSIATSLGSAEETLLHPAVFQPGELLDWANARLVRSRFSMLRGRAVVAGDATLAPMDTVEILGVSDRFNGKVLVSAVIHTVDENGWQSELRLGLSPEWFAREPDIVDVPSGGLLPPLRGLQIGTVGSLDIDQDQPVRVAVSLPGVPTQQGFLWARMATPDAGSKRGFVFRPEAGDEVIIGFLNEDPRQPIVLGALHSDKNKPPKPVEAPTNTNDQRAIVSRAGTRIVFDDAQPSLCLETTDGGNADGTYKSRIVIDEKAKRISIEDGHGNIIEMVKAGINLTSKKDITITADGKVVIKGKSVDIQ